MRVILSIIGILLIYAAYLIAILSNDGDTCSYGHVHEEIGVNNSVSWILWGTMLVLGGYAIHLLVKNIVINAKKKQIDN